MAHDVTGKGLSKLLLVTRYQYANVGPLTYSFESPLPCGGALGVLTGGEYKTVLVGIEEVYPCVGVPYELPVSGEILEYKLKEAHYLHSSIFMFIIQPPYE